MRIKAILSHFLLLRDKRTYPLLFITRFIKQCEVTNEN